MKVSVTDSSSSQTQKSSTWEEGKSSSEETSVEAGVKSSAGFSDFGFSASVEVSTSVGHRSTAGLNQLI